MEILRFVFCIWTAIQYQPFVIDTTSFIISLFIRNYAQENWSLIAQYAALVLLYTNQSRKLSRQNCYQYQSPKKNPYYSKNYFSTRIWLKTKLWYGVIAHSPIYSSSTTLHQPIKKVVEPRLLSIPVTKAKPMLFL